MRYYVDGYNLLFRAFRSEEELQERRDRFLEALNEKVELLQLQVTVVFDSQYQTGEATRSGFGALEVIFTDVGVTADECILHLLKGNASKNIVVTSDKRLAWMARRNGSRTESSEEFLAWLNKRYHNRLRRLKKPRIEPKPIERKISVEKPAKRPRPKATLAECFDYYLEVFEHRLEEEENG